MSGLPALSALPHAGRVALALLLALPAAWLCERASVPLPWMIGPLLATALCGVAGLPLAASVRLRNAGLWMIGVALGLYFTPQVVALLLPLAPAVVAGVLWALALGYGFYRFLHRLNGGDVATCYFGAAIGGASEMALLAERHHAQVDRVAAAHSLRVLLVVVLIPVAYQLLGVHGADAAQLAVQTVRLQGLALLVLASAAGVALLWRLGAPNPWVLGALAVCVVTFVVTLRINHARFGFALKSIRNDEQAAEVVGIRIFPAKPISQKPAEVRMGNGKGNPEYYVAEIQPGKVLYEMDGVEETLAREAFALAAAKLPISTVFVARHVGA